MTQLGLFYLLSALLVAFTQGQYSFLTLGDWGGAATKPEYAANVELVAAQLVKTANSAHAKFILNLGDSFYWCGITSTSDAQIAKDFTGPFGAMPTIPWYGVLGNHGYGYSADAQVQYSQVNPQWVMPSRYYTKRIKVDKTTKTYISFIFLDTSPCVKMYRGTNQRNYDPCGTQMPTCSPLATNDDFEGKCDFHANIMTQSCDAQYTWFQRTLNAVPKDDWLIVVGHHPADEINVKDFTSLMQKRGFSMYFNGHAHTLTQYQVDGSGAYVTSGAGSLVDTPDQTGELMKRKLAGDAVILMNEAADGSYQPMSAYESWYGGVGQKYASRYSRTKSKHTYSTIWNKKVAGFTLSTFSSDFQSLTTKFISYDGTVIHQFTSLKNGQLKRATGSWLSVRVRVRAVLSSVQEYGRKLEMLYSGGKQ